MPYQKLLISLLTILILLTGANLVVSLIQLTQPAEPIAVVQTQDDVSATPTSVPECSTTRACSGDFTCVDGVCVAEPVKQIYNGPAVSFTYPADWSSLTETVEGNPFFAVTYFDDELIVLPDGPAFYPLFIQHYAPDLHLSPEAFLWAEIREKGVVIDAINNVYFLEGISDFGGLEFEAFLHVGEKESVILYANSLDTRWQEIKKSIQWK